jgi:hypothetical protein
VAGATTRSNGDSPRFDRINPALQAAAAGDPSTARALAAEMQATGRADIAWATTQPVDPCFSSLQSAWNTWRQALVESGDAINGLLDGSVDEQGLLDALAAFVRGQQAYIDALAIAQPACGGGTPEPTAT